MKNYYLKVACCAHNSVVHDERHACAFPFWLVYDPDNFPLQKLHSEVLCMQPYYLNQVLPSSVGVREGLNFETRILMNILL